MNKKTIIAALIFVLIALYTISLKVKLEDSLTLQDSYKNKIENLEKIKNGDSYEANKSFLERFFNHNNTKQRNAEIKEYMTHSGFQSILVGSTDQEDVTEVETSSSNIKSYERKSSKAETEYLNEFDLTIKFNEVSSTDNIFVKTKLIYVHEEGWKIDAIEFIGEITNEWEETD